MRRPRPPLHPPPLDDAQYIALLSGDAWFEIGQLPDAMA